LIHDKMAEAKGSNMDDVLRRKVCRLIAGIVVSDEDLSPQEDAFVDRMLERFGIPKEEREVIFPIVDATEAAGAMRELPEDFRLEAFGLLVDAAAAYRTWSACRGTPSPTNSRKPSLGAPNNRFQSDREPRFSGTIGAAESQNGLAGPIR
jgi:hypothetical protein